MASFPLFPCFPVEIQYAVWAFAAVLVPEPEVCLVWPVFLESVTVPGGGRRTDEPVLPFIVDTGWPAVAHVCRVSREAAFNSMRLRYSPLAGFAVPYRHFMPSIDTLYCGRFQYIPLCRFLDRPENAHITRDLRHLALEISTPVPCEVAAIIRTRAIYLRTLSFILPGTMNLPCTTVSFLRPARRCRLRNISDDALDEIAIARISFPRPGETLPMPLRKYLDHQRAALDRHIRDWSVGGDEGTAWSTKDDSFSGMEITAQTFVEYRYTGGTEGSQEEEQWVEVCRDRLLGTSKDSDMAPRPRRVRAEDRKNSEDYRVLDDDGRMYTMEEFMADIKRDHPEYTGFYHPNAGLGD